MGTIALKLTLTPVLILAASLAGRRWGQTVGGWLAALPLATGPVTFFLAVEQGTGFAARAAAGALAGAAAEACFWLAFGAAAGRSWAIALVAGSLAFIAAGHRSAPPGSACRSRRCAHGGEPRPLPRLMPSRTLAGVDAGDGCRPGMCRRAWRSRPPGSLASPVQRLLGPRLSGLIATFPVFGAVLGIFAMRLQGAAAARQVMRGVLAGLFSFAAFFLALGLADRTPGNRRGVHRRGPAAQSPSRPARLGPARAEALSREALPGRPPQRR